MPGFLRVREATAAFLQQVHNEGGCKGSNTWKGRALFVTTNPGSETRGTSVRFRRSQVKQ